MELAESIDRLDLTGVSFGFTPNADVRTSDEQGVLRTLISVNLLELSPCSFPAYRASSVSIRSCPVELRAKLKLAKRTNADGCDCECPECLDGSRRRFGSRYRTRRTLGQV
jgi:phage head maturation protease